MPVELVGIPFRWRDLHLRNLAFVVFVIQAISQNIAKRSQGAFQRICGGFFLRLLKGRRFALTILYVAVANILPIASVSMPSDSRDRELTSWYVPSFSVTRMMTLSPKLILPVDWA